MWKRSDSWCLQGASAGTLESSALLQLVFVLFISCMSLLLVRLKRMPVALCSIWASNNLNIYICIPIQTFIAFLFYHITPEPSSNSLWIQWWYSDDVQIDHGDRFFYLYIPLTISESLCWLLDLHYIFCNILKRCISLKNCSVVFIFFPRNAASPWSFPLFSQMYTHLEFRVGNIYS